MLFESNHVRVSADHGTATLWLAFPGDPANALDLARLGELDSALAAIEGNPFLRTLVIRSGLPAGFCAGLRPAALASLGTDAERAHFSWRGQQVFERLAALPFATVAFIDGPCLGAGLELALACDFRLCVARPTTHLGFPEVGPCFGGSVRLRQLIGRRAKSLLESGGTLSGREAQRLGLVQRAFCERRAKIELRTFLDERERSGASPPVAADGLGFAAERRAFARSTFRAAPAAPLLDSVPPFPAVVGLASDDEFAVRLVAEAVLRGSAAIVVGESAGVGRGIDAALGRGFVTPLEAEQARARVTATAEASGFERAGLVFAEEAPVRVAPRGVVAVTSRIDGARAPRRAVGVRFAEGRAELVQFPSTDADAAAALTAWLKPFGIESRLQREPPLRAAA